MLLGKTLRSLDYTAVLALIGTVFAALLSASFIPDLLVNPAVNVEVIASETTTPRMIITNDGSEPANNVHLFIWGYDKGNDLGKWKINSVRNNFSTTNVSLVQPKSQLGQQRQLDIDKSQCFFNKPECFPQEPIDLLEIHIPKLVQGLGSEVMITPSLESPIRNYKVVVSYDEGSGIVSNNPNYIRTISFYFTYYILFTQGGITISIALMTFALIIPILIFIRYRYHKGRKQKLIDHLLNTIQSDRQEIVRKNDTSDPLHIHPCSDLRYIMGPKDYAIISDLYTKIEERNKKMEDPRLHDYDKREANNEILNLMENALNIEWDNYL